MKTIVSFFCIVLLFVCCHNNHPGDSANMPANRKILDYSKFGDAHDYDSLLSQIACPGVADSLMDIRITVLQDSINELYDQLIVRLEVQSKKEKFEQDAIPFLESVVESERGFLETIGADADLLFYSYGHATGRGLEARCLKIDMLQNRLLLLKAVFENSYWNYDFDGIQ